MKTNNRKSKLGFTLIEILIVVAIIAILASVVLIGLGPLQRQGRDARRISDLKQVQTGLELYYNREGQYPPSGVSWDADIIAPLKAADIGVSNVPADPSSGKTYHYWSNGTQYVLGAVLDDANHSAYDQDVDVDATNALTSECGAGGAGADTMYCIAL